jgi:lipoprotein-releasing system permease protein
MIALRYLRAKRAEGGVSVMTWISFIGITLAVFALIATMAVRSGFRAEFVDTILGSNAHVTVYKAATVNAEGQMDRGIYEYEAIAKALRKVPGVYRVAPLVKGQVMASHSGRNAGVAVFGITLENLLTLPRIARPETYSGDINRFQSGIAIGSGVARELGVIVGDRIKLMSPDGVKTAFGISPRVKS